MRYFGWIAYVAMCALSFAVGKAGAEEWPVGKQVENLTVKPGLFVCETVEQLTEVIASPKAPVAGCGRTSVPFLIVMEIIDHYTVGEYVYTLARYDPKAAFTTVGVQPTTGMPSTYGIWLRIKLDQGA